MIYYVAKGLPFCIKKTGGPVLRKGSAMLRLRRDIPLFPEGKRKAFTMSFDDGVTQDERLISLMRKYGLKGTFNINAGLMGERDWLVQPGIDVSHYKFPAEKVKDVYRGFETAVHTMSHADLTTVAAPMVSYEITECKKELEEIVCRPVRGMAYPFGTWNQAVLECLKFSGIEYARTVNSTGDFRLPEEFLVWNPTCHYAEERTETLAEQFLENDTKENYREPLLFYIWGHSYELDAFDQWDRIEQLMKKIGGNSEIWYAENIEICDYMKAVKNLIYSASGDFIFNPSAQAVWLLIDRKEYCIPGGSTITVERL